MKTTLQGGLIGLRQGLLLLLLSGIFSAGLLLAHSSRLGPAESAATNQTKTPLAKLLTLSNRAALAQAPSAKTETLPESVKTLTTELQPLASHLADSHDAQELNKAIAIAKDRESKLSQLIIKDPAAAIAAALPASSRSNLPHAIQP